MKSTASIDRTHRQLSMVAMIVSMVASVGMLGISLWNVQQTRKAQQPKQ